MKNREEFGKLYQEYYKKGIGAEIGVESGFNALDIAKEWKGKILCVDNWNIEPVYKVAIENLKGDKFVITKGLSVDVAKDIKDGSLDWVYIDAEHDYQSVKDDLEAWYPKVRDGGVISGHDYCEIVCLGGVIKAIDEFAEKNGYKANVTTEDGWKQHKMDVPSWWFIKR